jgi:hypothetical protein
MSFVTAVPEAFAIASGDLTGIGSAIQAANAAAAPFTTGVLVSTAGTGGTGSLLLLGAPGNNGLT